MKHEWSASSQFGQKLFFPKGQIDCMCEDELQKANLLPATPGPVNIERFVEKHYARIEYIDLGEGVLGCAEFSRTGKVTRVVINSRLDSDHAPTERRLRSTLAHEAGHCMLHAGLFIDDGLQQSFTNLNTEILRERRFLCRESDVRAESERKAGWDGKWWEYQANRAIGGFLLPRKLVAEAIEPHLSPSSGQILRTLDSSQRQTAIRAIADLFEVNPAVASIRLSEMYPANSAQMTL